MKSSLTLLFIPSVLAARPCPASPQVQWTISEYTYDAPDPTARGRAAINAAVGLYLSTGSAEHSCFGQWPEAWNGWSADNATLIWSSCINNRGRMDDTTVSFAMDWRTRTLHAAHTFVCSDGERKGQTILSGVEVKLDLDCGGDPLRCLTKERRIPVTTAPKTVGCADVSWEVTGYGGLYDLSTGVTAKEGAALFTLKGLDGGVYRCVSDGTGAGGTCEGEVGTAKFGFDKTTKILSIEQTKSCSGTSATFKGAVSVPAFCSTGVPPDCATDSTFWVAGKSV
ncbi:hypothetical protein OQA88_6036 [Cercophora sp. LCS_1]